MVSFDNIKTEGQQTQNKKDGKWIVTFDDYHLAGRKKLNYVPDRNTGHLQFYDSVDEIMHDLLEKRMYSVNQLLSRGTDLINLESMVGIQHELRTVSEAVSVRFVYWARQTAKRGSLECKSFASAHEQKLREGASAGVDMT